MCVRVGKTHLFGGWCGDLLDGDVLCALVVLLGELEVPQELRVNLASSFIQSDRNKLYTFFLLIPNKTMKNNSLHSSTDNAW